jgi:hypothetical protein
VPSSPRASLNSFALSLSTQESEIQALSEAARYVLYFRYILNELGIHQDPTVIYEDNNAAISFAKGESDFDRTKHIARHYRFIAQQYEFGELDVVRIDTKQTSVPIRALKFYTLLTTCDSLRSISTYLSSVGKGRTVT